jgi:hypothetical protein
VAVDLDSVATEVREVRRELGAHAQKEELAMAESNLRLETIQTDSAKGTAAMIRLADIAEERANFEREARTRANEEATKAADWWRGLVSGNAKWALLVVLAVVAPQAIPYVLAAYGVAPAAAPAIAAPAVAPAAP